MIHTFSASHDAASVSKRPSRVLRQIQQGWFLRLGKEHPVSCGVTGDRSEVPAGLHEQSVPATVPGCVHTDLLAAGLIPDPYVADHERKLWWIGRCDWIYHTRFDASDLRGHDHVELCFDGLDTLATLVLNGIEIGQTANMHRRYRFEVRSILLEKDNELEVRFVAPVPAARNREQALGELPRAGGGSNPSLPHNMLRKMSSNFGWDWGPVVPTCGIWREVRLEAWSGGRLGDVRPAIREASADRAVVEVDADVVGGGEVTATLTDPGGQVFSADRATITVPNPQRWWPVGHGEATLYTLTVRLHAAGGIIDEKTHRIGLRHIELDTAVDNGQAQPAEGLGEGSQMLFRVNGKPIYCKGANWIPDDCFLPRVTRDRYRQRVRQAVDANLNMLRVWGGGVFESEDFYEACDEAGLMVWQDFLMACAAYPEDEQTRQEVEAEARDNVSRLAHHPSLVLLNGCNENLWAYREWDYQGQRWRDSIGGRPWGEYYYFDLYPKVCRQLAPSVCYWPGSPSNGGGKRGFREADPNSNEHGNRHVWNVWHGPGHYANYFGHYPRFCSEFGFHGPATWPAIDHAIPVDQRRWDSAVMRQHNKNGLSELGDGQDKANTRMADDFDRPAHFDDWLYLAQVMQARALTVGVGWFRSLFPWNSGALIWQLNDCWPCSSWSMLDLDTRGVARAKPMLHAARRFFAPRVINIGPCSPQEIGSWNDDPGNLRVYLHNDHDEHWATHLRLRLMTYDGETVHNQSHSLSIAPRSACQVDVPKGWKRTRDVFLVAEAKGGVRGFWWFAADKDAPLPRPHFETTVVENRVTVRAKTMLRDLCLFAGRLHPGAAADDGAVTLLPGESHTFAIRGVMPEDTELLTRPPVLRCIGDGY